MHPPSGNREERSGVVSVKLGFGSVSFPAVDAARPSPEETIPGKKLACNRGLFSLRYDLARDGSGTKIRRVSVTVKNQAEYIAPRDRRLEEHERGHQRINEAAVGRLEKSLATFRTDTKDLKTAERRLQAKFREELESVKALHREWDANSVIMSRTTKEAMPPAATTNPGNGAPKKPWDRRDNRGARRTDRPTEAP